MDRTELLINEYDKKFSYTICLISISHNTLSDSNELEDIIMDYRTYSMVQCLHKI